MKLWTVAKLARCLKTSERTVRRALRSDGVEIVRVNSSVKVRNSIVIDWLGFDPERDSVWTIPEVARESGFSVPTIERTIRSGRLGSVLLCARVRRVLNSQLVAWLGFDPLDEPETYRAAPRRGLREVNSEQPYLFEVRSAS